MKRKKEYNDGYLFLGHADVSFVPDGFTVHDLGLNIYKKEK